MMLPMVPQTSPQWQQTTGNERTKDAVSVIAARNCATGTATTNRTTANRTGSPTTMTTATTTTTTTATTATTSKKRRQFLRTSGRTMTCQQNLPFTPILVLLFVNFGTYLVTCSSPSDQDGGMEPQLMTFPRSTLPDRPMTTQNDLITTARNSTTLLTAKKPTATITTTPTSAAATTTGHSGATLVMTSTAPTIITTTTRTRTTTRTGTGMGTRTRTTGATERETKSVQIGLTTKPTAAAAAAAAAAAKQTPSTKATSATRTMFISTIYPTSTTDPTTASPVLPVQMAAATALALALTETDARNSIEMPASLASAGKQETEQVVRQEEEAEEHTTVEEEEKAVLQVPHAASDDSLTKGFSIPTFLPPFPVFAAADLPAYRAAAAAAEAAAVAAAAAEAAAASTIASETVTLSPEQQRQQMFNEQHSYLASHNGQLEPGQQARKNLTMPVLNITAQMGNHAYMPCQIHRLSDKPVSWVRLRDGHIISVDETTFIADERFQSIFQEDHDYTWSLQIKYVEPGDAGSYECQMATEPKLSAKVHLEVITPKTELIGDQSRFVKAGSKVALHCIVRGTLDPPKYIIWFRGQKKISESDEHTGWYTQLDRNIFGSVADNQNTIGSLIIPFVRKEDSGNYTCQPSNSVSVSVDLHVLSGEYSASAIKSSATERAVSSTFLVLVLRLTGLVGALEMRRGPWRLGPVAKT